MMNLIKIGSVQKILLLLILCSACFSSVDAQLYNSPYSRYGIGDFTDPNFILLRGMGGLGSSYSDKTTINPVNPASYSSLTLASYDVSLYAEYASVSDATVTEERWQGNLEYIGLAFPLRNYKNDLLDPKKRKFKYGMAFFAKPYSRVSYNVSTLEEREESSDILRTFSGTGGTYQLAWGNSIKYKSFSAGANLGFLYGLVRDDQEVSLNDDPAGVTDFLTNNYSIASFLYDFGVIYELVLNKQELEDVKTAKRKKLNFGLRGTPGSSFRTVGESSHLGSNVILGITDTISFNEEIIGSGDLPMTIGGGITYYNGNQLVLGVDAEFSRFTNFENPNRPNQNFVNAYKVAIGGKYRPDERGFGTFLERTSYTAGLYYEKDPRVVSGQELSAYGIRVGTAFPFFYQQNFSSINMNFDIGRRGNPDVIQENFIRINLGLNFNDDSWFIQRKYN
jgi:hypothetical protein